MAEVAEHYRLFVALPVPEVVRTAIGKTQDALRELLPKAGVRWSPPTQFHLTLRFLGDVEGARVEALTSALRLACAELAPFAVRAEGLGFFPDDHHPRVVWAGLADEAGELERLWESVQAATGEFTSQPVEHRFAGHITLGRIKFLSPRDRTALVAQAGRQAGRRFGQWQAERVDLMRSELSSQGARHTCLASLAFGRRVA